MKIAREMTSNFNSTKDIRIKSLIMALMIAVTSMMSLSSCYYYETVTDYDVVPLQNEYNTKFNGCTRSQIINSCGAPNRIVPIDGQSVILVYENYSVSVNEPIDPLGLGIGSTTVDRTRIYAEFYIGNDGRCYNVKTNRSKIVPYTRKEKRYY